MKKKKIQNNGSSKSPNRKKIIFSVAAVVIVAAVFFLARMDFTVLTKISNGEFFEGNYKFLIDPEIKKTGLFEDVRSFVEEDFYHPRLQLLRKREKLDWVIVQGNTQFEKILLLLKWAHSQWIGYTGKFYYPPWDALEILDLARKYNNYGFCAQYAVVFLQACQSVGLHARYVDLPGHFVTAVWSDDYDRWVIMDPTNGSYYEKNGIPMKGMELCAAYWDNRVRGIYRVGTDGVKTAVKRDDISYYRMYSILLRTNQLSEPEVIVDNGAPRKLTLNPDYRKYPYISRDSVGFTDPALAWKEKKATEFFSGKDYTNDQDNFRYVENQTIIFYSGSHNGIAKIKLISENSETFKLFLISIDGTDWREANTSVIPWQLSPGLNKLSARVLTKFGWQGHISSVELFYKPGWFRSRVITQVD
jgi:hypothetical protein